MLADTQIRQQILRKIRRIPSDKLNDLKEYLNKLEQTTEKSSKILSYAGSWNNIDESALNQLTDNLISNRIKNSRRFDE
jgi:signal transduction histidine kinase